MAVNQESSAFPSTSTSSQPSRKRSNPVGSGSDQPGKRSKTVHCPSIASAESSGSSELSTPFTRDFFKDMAAMILLGFPIREFARKHHCRRGDVSDALRAIVVEPLRKSNSAHHQSIINKWCTGDDDIAHSIPGAKEGRREYPIDIASTSDSSTGEEASLPHQTIVIIDEPSCSESDSESTTVQPAVICASNSDDNPSDKTVSVGNNIATTAETRRWSGMPPTERVKVRVDLWGSYIPVNKWIDGWHQIRPVPADAMSDEDFEEWLNRQKGRIEARG